MPDLVQLNLSVDQPLRDEVDELAERYGLSKRQVVTAGVYALRVLLEHHAHAIERSASDGIEADVLDLFKRLVREVPAPLAIERVDWGRLGDGRPALILNDWVIADDAAGDLMAIRRDGNQVGYLARGDIQPLAERAISGEVQPLQTAAEASLD